jgi:PAS domain S-box-containing protein
MNDQDKTKEELIIELRELKQENSDLKALLDDGVAKNKIEDDLVGQAHKNFEIFFNTINDFLFILDMKGNIIHTNSVVIDRLGYTREELSGLSVLLLHPADRRDEAGRIVEEMLRGIKEFCPIPIVAKSGIQIPVETRVTIGTWDGKPVIFGVTKDISEVKLSEEKFSKVFYLNPSLCGLSDLETGKYVEVNDQFYSLLGFEKNEVIGKTATELGILTTDTINVIKSKAEKNGNVTNIGADLKAKNGAIKHVLLSSENIYLQDKKYRFTVVHDITELKQAEDEISRQAGMISSLLDSIPDIIFFKDKNGVYLGCNPPFAEFVGRSRGEIVGKTDYDLFDKEIADFFRKHDKSMLEVDKSQKNEEWITYPDGRKILIDTLKTPYRDQTGNVIGILGISRDITERKQQEEKLRENEERFNLAINGTGAGLWDWDMVNDTVFFSSHWKSMLGYEDNEVENAFSGWKRLWHPDDSPHIEQALNDYLEGRTTRYEIEHRLRHKDGSWLWIRTLGNIQKDASGKPVRWTGTNQDVTDRKHAEDEIKLKNEELVELNSVKDKFFSIIAHDLRSPFNSIIGFCDLLLEQVRNNDIEGIDEYAQIILKSSKSSMDLLTNLMEWAHTQTGRIEFNPEYFEIVAFIEKNKEIYIDIASQKSITIKHILPHNLTVFADMNMISTICRNMILNAIKFTMPGGEVNISVKEKQNEIIFSVSDTGVGIPQNRIDKLFRIDQSFSTAGTNNEKGTGLGLILCKEFIEKHNGKIWVESLVGVGTTFNFSLPLSFENVHTNVFKE